MLFSKPAPTTYLRTSSDSKTIDLVNLCRRLCAEIQYHGKMISGNLVKLHPVEWATSNQHVYEAIKEKLESFVTRQNLPPWIQMQPQEQDLVTFFNQLPVNRYEIKVTLEKGSLKPKRVTAKDFKYIGSNIDSAQLKGDKLRRIYWKLRLNHLSTIGIMQVVRVIIEDLKKQKYKGLLLPNGKVVPFEALKCFGFLYGPKELTVMEFPKYCPHGGRSEEHPTRILSDAVAGFRVMPGPQGGLICSHFALAINLPETDTQGNFGRVMMIDPTCAQFGMQGKNGDLFYWGYYEDYVKAFPAGYVLPDEMGELQTMLVHFNNKSLDLNMVKAVLANLKFDSCAFCGEVERKEGNVEIKLKKCSNCKKVFYCDALCQKMGWKGHKLECKAE